MCTHIKCHDHARVLHTGTGLRSSGVGATIPTTSRRCARTATPPRCGRRAVPPGCENSTARVNVVMAVCSSPFDFHAAVAAPCRDPRSGACALAVSQAASVYGSECLGLPISPEVTTLPPFRAYVCTRGVTGPLAAQCRMRVNPGATAAGAAPPPADRATGTAPLMVASLLGASATAIGVKAIGKAMVTKRPARDALSRQLDQQSAEIRQLEDQVRAQDDAKLAETSLLEQENAALQAKVDSHAQALQKAYEDGHFEGVFQTLQTYREIPRLQAPLDALQREKVSREGHVRLAPTHNPNTPNYDPHNRPSRARAPSRGFHESTAHFS